MSEDDLLTQLHNLVMATLEEGRKTSYSLDERDRLNQEAKNIRKRLVLLRQVQFDHNTSGYQQAGKDIGVINGDLAQAKARIDDLVTFLGNLATLAKALDELLKAAIPS